MSQDIKISNNCTITRANLKNYGIMSGMPRFDTREYSNTYFDIKYPYNRFLWFPIGDKYTIFNYTAVLKADKAMNIKLSLIEVNETTDTETSLVVIEDVLCPSNKTIYLNWAGKTGENHKSYRLLFETDTACNATATIIRDYTSIIQFNACPEPGYVPTTMV